MSIVNQYLDIPTQHAVRLADSLRHDASLPCTLAHPPEWPNGPGVSSFAEAAQAALESAERRTHTLQRVATQIADLSRHAIQEISDTDEHTSRSLGGR